jgi:hypothetical protein
VRGSDIYYTAPVLDPCIKGDLLLAKLENGVTSKDILKGFYKNIHQNYLVSIVKQSGSVLPFRDYSTKYSNVEIWMPQRL